MPRGKKNVKKEEPAKVPHAIVELANGRNVSGYLLGSENEYLSFRGDDGVTGQIHETFVVAVWYKEADEEEEA